MNRFRYLMFVTTIVLMFALCAVRTAPAFADDGIPPVDAGASDPQPTADPVAEEAPASTDVITQLPEDTSVVVLDEVGNSVPLATQEAAQNLTDGDPLWCPVGVAPKGGIGGCSPSFNRFGSSGDSGSLIDWLISNQQNKAGTIWVEHTYDNPAVETAANITFSGGAYTTMDNFALTIQGGWIGGLTGSKLLFTADPYSYFNSTFWITGWTGAVTINNIVLDGIMPTVAAPNTALSVSTKGNIVLNNVSVLNNDNLDDSQPTYLMTGASLDNTSGTGTVTINNSDFSGNEGDGLVVLSTGAITTYGLVANFNGGSGAQLQNDSVQSKAVTLKGFKQFNNNGSSGLSVISAGAITLSNIVANYNTGDGVDLDNTASTANLGIILGGTNFTMSNAGTGLGIFSHGTITANNLNSSGNDGAGAILDNCDDNGSDCNLLLAKTVKLTGINIFNNNGTLDEGGLVIESFGAISVSNITASDNLGAGAHLDNQWTNLAIIDSVGTVTLIGRGTFQNNSDDGLEGYSYGSILLTNIDASFNGGTGAYLEAVKFTGGSSVTLNGVNTFNNNGTVDEDGLDVLAFGAITVSNITANFNVGGGAFLDNCLFNFTACTSVLKPYNVILKGTNTFQGNTNFGGLGSSGSIIANNLTANSNGLDGIYLDNCNYNGSTCDTPTPKAVTVTGYINTSNNLGGAGLIVDSTGTVTLNNITAEWNADGGAYIRNDADGTKALAITLKGSNTFNYNGDDDSGLEVYSYGAITANNITAFENADAGAYLVNTGGVTPKNITLTGVNAFVGNYHDGLYFEASGSAILNQVNADGNGWDVDPGNGITGTAGGGISLTCAITTNQVNGAGYDLTAVTTITIKGIYSARNDDNDGTLAGGLVSITKPCLLP